MTRGERRRLSEFGRGVGLAFQLRDDALDYSGSDEELGKRAYDDLREGKVTLPLLMTLKRSTPAERGEIVNVLKALAKAAAHGEAVPEEREDAIEGVDLSPVIGLVEQYRGVEDTVRRARDLAKSAIASIEPFPDGSGKRALLAAADYAVGREN